MAIDAKIDFLRKIEETLADRITVNDMGTIMSVLSDILEGFEMRSITRWEDEKDDFLNCYVSALKVENRSQKTVDRYVYVIGRFMKYAQIPTRQVTVYHLRSYLSREKERGIADRTLEGIREVFTAYFNWLQREGLIERNPTANLGTVKCAKKEKKTYTEIDMENLNRMCDSLRDRAIVNFLASTGCRISEMTELDRDSISLQALECVVHGKGNKERVVYLTPVAGMLLTKYLESRKDDSPALFAGKGSPRLKPGGVRAMLNRLAKKAGVDHVHPHKFRRTLATDLSRHGMPIQEVANILGHEKLDTTMQYVVLDKENTKTSFRRYV